MFKITKKKMLIGGLLCCLTIAIVLALINFLMPTSVTHANANSLAAKSSGESPDFVVTDTKNEVLATYMYSKLNDTECSVKIANKTVATKAIIPSKTEIDGAEYRVTEIAANGFASSSKLIRVSLPKSITKLNNMAFANCANLERISLANVKEIGNSVFYKCPKLDSIILPKSVEKMGNTVFRSNTTQVYARAEVAGENWSATWNNGNSNQDVQFNSTYYAPLELETVYSNLSAKSEPTTIGYIVAGGQPRTDEFYIVENSDIFIPNMYNDELIIGISQSAFEDTAFNQLIIEYSANPIFIGSEAFNAVNCNNITINRDVKFENIDSGEPSDSIFTFSMFQTIILPDTLTEIPVSTFMSCENLTNIYFKAPIYKEKREDVLNFINELNEETVENGEEGIVHLLNKEYFNKICETAFDGTTSIKEMHIYSNIESIDSGAFDNWTEEQKVYIHNENKNFTVNWHTNALRGLNPENVIYDATYYTLSLDANGGEVSVSSIDVKLNRTLGELPVPQYAHHVFLGWFDADNNKYDENTVYTAESNTTLTAQWRNYGYSIRYHRNRPNEATKPVIGAMENSNHIYGESSALSENLYTIAGWHFTGWNTEEDGSGASYTDKAEISTLNDTDGATTVLYAQWAQNTYTFCYYENEPDTYYSVQGYMDDTLHTCDTAEASYLRANTFTLAGWEFKGWLDDDGNPYADMAAVNFFTEQDNQVIILYAQWEIIKYTVTFETNGGVNPNSVKEFTVDDEITLQAPVKPGHDGFWSPSVIPRGTYQHVTVYASYIPRRFYVDCYMDAEKNENLKHYELDQGESCSLEPVTRNGYYFGGWKYKGEYLPYVENIQTDMELYAVWYSKTDATNTYVISRNFDEPFTDYELEVSGEKVIVELQIYGPMVTNIIVKSNVKQLIIHSEKYDQYYINITVESRSQELDVVLLNFCLNAFPYDPAIYMPYDYTLNLYGYNCIIKGNAGSDAIVCKKLAICSPITVSGGGGDNWANGPYSAVKADKLIIKSGYITLVGGDGYDKSGGASAVRQGTQITFDGDYQDTVIFQDGLDDNG